ncbi:hypothetical protein M422DRAFT_56656 [Sphaerobolus stellatus SS14]|uniref:XPG-I domain-containing protein n=1 Tax=Sphaerobolus stellatus (strain SS14) TaxID=990650 RepID=A0A0C9UFE1_SPHS4|nr:hypothetical protein M422DRAFT_56656 [Sphaerobolus stellatus SS14]
MGVPAIWSLLRRVGLHSQSLLQHTTEEGFDKNLHGNRVYNLGIDMTSWLEHQAQYMQMGEQRGSILQVLLFRFFRLVAMPVKPLFVLDGPPTMADQSDNCLVSGLNDMMAAFGFESIKVPREGGKKLAQLNQLGIIDGILSDNVDCFLLGAKVVIREHTSIKRSNRNKTIKHSVSIYNSSSFQTLDLTEGGLLIMGLLVGNDNDKKGLPGCGVEIAYGLAKSGLGDSLLAASKHLTGKELKVFIKQWRQELSNELATNASGKNHAKFPKLATAVQKVAFPSIRALKFYTSPVVSESSLDLKTTETLPLDISRIVVFCYWFPATFIRCLLPKLVEEFEAINPINIDDLPSSSANVLHHNPANTSGESSLSGNKNEIIIISSDSEVEGKIGQACMKIPEIIEISSDEDESQMDK